MCGDNVLSGVMSDSPIWRRRDDVEPRDEDDEDEDGVGDITSSFVLLLEFELDDLLVVIGILLMLLKFG